MESETKYTNIDHNAPPLPIRFADNNMKLETLDDDFSMDNFSSSNVGYLQDFQHLDHIASSFDPILGIQSNTCDPFDPFRNGSSTGFELYGFKPFDQENGISTSVAAAMQNFQGGGFLNFSKRGDILMGIETALNLYDPKPLNFIVPDESSCMTADNMGFHKGNGLKRSRNSNLIKGLVSNEIGSVLAAKRSGKSRKKSKSSKGQWTVEEDRQLVHLVEKFGVRKWSHIAQLLKGRIGKQCRERWHNHLRPDIKVKDLWTEEEDRVLIEAHAEVGNKWAEIAKRLPGRTENSIKNHWNATKRRQFSRRKCRTKWPRPSSLLQNYIKSLNFEKDSGKKSKNVSANAPITPSTETVRLNNASKAVGGMDFSPTDHMVPDFDFDEVPDFTFDDDHVFEGSNMGSFMDDIPNNLPCELDDNEACFDLELPFDMPPLMQVKKELDILMA